MKKIYIVIAGAFLILLIITSMLLSLQKKAVTNTQKNYPFPTGIPDRGTNGQPVNNPSITTDSTNFEPFETLDFKAAYVPELDKIVVEQKTPIAEQSFNQWVQDNKINQIIDNKNKILFTKEKIIPTPSDSIHKLENTVINFFQLMDDLNNISKGSPSPSSNLPISKSPKEETKKVTDQTTNQSTKFTYFAQCGDQGNLPLPDGDTLCHAGCGPTTVAMIASSLVDKKYDPKAIVEIYRKNNYLLGGSGSRYTDAHELLKGLGLKTTDYLVFDSEKSDTVVPQLRKYLNAGWTFFTLASYCSGGCGHYFWITDIDASGNIWAYDPAYGRYQIPYNENTRYPYPLYLLAFGVKKQ
jgi:hypothetical protein